MSANIHPLQPGMNAASFGPNTPSKHFRFCEAIKMVKALDKPQRVPWNATLKKERYVIDYSCRACGGALGNSIRHPTSWPKRCMAKTSNNAAIQGTQKSFPKEMKGCFRLCITYTREYTWKALTTAWQEKLSKILSSCIKQCVSLYRHSKRFVVLIGWRMRGKTTTVWQSLNLIIRKRMECQAVV